MDQIALKMYQKGQKVVFLYQQCLSFLRIFCLQNMLTDEIILSAVSLRGSTTSIFALVGRAG